MNNASIIDRISFFNCLEEISNLWRMYHISRDNKPEVIFVTKKSNFRELLYKIRSDYSFFYSIRFNYIWNKCKEFNALMMFNEKFETRNIFSDWLFVSLLNVYRMNCTVKIKYRVILMLFPRLILTFPRYASGTKSMGV